MNTDTETVCCANHASTKATWQCCECQRPLCGACVKHVQLEPGRSVVLCRTCDGLCERWTEPEAGEIPPGLFQGLMAALVYPLRGSAVLLLGASVLLEVLTRYAGRAVFFGGMIFVVGLAIGAYVVTFLRQIILSSADGANAVPAWPEYQPQALSEAALEFIGVYFVCFGPWMLCSIWRRSDPDATKYICEALFLAGACYYPMALLAVVIYDDLRAVSPLLIVTSMLRAPLAYLTTCLFLGSILGGAWLLVRALGSLGVPLLTNALSTFVWGYGTILLMRVMGWFYYCEKEQLAWM